MKLMNKQRIIFTSITSNLLGLNVLNGTPRSGKIFFVKYITQYFQAQNKKVIISGTTESTTLRLSYITNTIHTTFHIPSHGYLSIYFESSKVINRLQDADVIIINEMSMITSYMLCVIKQHLKHAMQAKNSSPFQTKLVLLVGDLTQLPAICKHNLCNNELICKACHIKISFYWSSAQQHYL